MSSKSTNYISYNQGTNSFKQAKKLSSLRLHGMSDPEIPVSFNKRNEDGNHTAQHSQS